MHNAGIVNKYLHLAVRFGSCYMDACDRRVQCTITHRCDVIEYIEHHSLKTIYMQHIYCALSRHTHTGTTIRPAHLSPIHSFSRSISIVNLLMAFSMLLKTIVYRKYFIKMTPGQDRAGFRLLSPKCVKNAVSEDYSFGRWHETHTFRSLLCFVLLLYLFYFHCIN